jgi:hypothetical protein
MEDALAKHVRAAAGAMWCTVVLGIIWLTVGWVFWLVIMHCQPGWIAWLWGGAGPEGLSWKTYQLIGMTFFGVFKLILFAAVLTALWLTLWARKLARTE